MLLLRFFGGSGGGRRNASSLAPLPARCRCSIVGLSCHPSARFQIAKKKRSRWTTRPGRLPLFRDFRCNHFSVALRINNLVHGICSSAICRSILSSCTCCIAGKTLIVRALCMLQWRANQTASRQRACVYPHCMIVCHLLFRFRFWAWRWNLFSAKSLLWKRLALWSSWWAAQHCWHLCQERRGGAGGEGIWPFDGAKENKLRGNWESSQD